MMFVGMAASLSIWALSANVWPLAIFAFVYGVFYGGWVAVLPAVVTDYFGGRNVSGIIGVRGLTGTIVQAKLTHLGEDRSSSEPRRTAVAHKHENHRDDLKIERHRRTRVTGSRRGLHRFAGSTFARMKAAVGCGGPWREHPYGSDARIARERRSGRVGGFGD
jgi:hypothetical protein